MGQFSSVLKTILVIQRTRWCRSCSYALNSKVAKKECSQLGQNKIDKLKKECLNGRHLLTYISCHLFDEYLKKKTVILIRTMMLLLTAMVMLAMIILIIIVNAFLFALFSLSSGFSALEPVCVYPGQGATF